MEKVCLEDNSIPSLPRRNSVVEKNIFPFSHLFQTSATFKVKLLVQLLRIGFKSGLGGWGPIREKLSSIHFQHWHCNWNLHSLSDQETWNAAAASFYFYISFKDKTFHLLYFVWGDPLLYWRTLKSNWKTFLAAQTNILLFSKFCISDQNHAVLHSDLQHWPGVKEGIGLWVMVRVSQQIITQTSISYIIKEIKQKNYFFTFPLFCVVCLLTHHGTNVPQQWIIPHLKLCMSMSNQDSFSVQHWPWSLQSALGTLGYFH